MKALFLLAVSLLFIACAPLVHTEDEVNVDASKAQFEFNLNMEQQLLEELLKHFLEQRGIKLEASPRPRQTVQLIAFHDQWFTEAECKQAFIKLAQKLNNIEQREDQVLGIKWLQRPMLTEHSLSLSFIIFELAREA